MPGSPATMCSLTQSSRILLFEPPVFRAQASLVSFNSSFHYLQIQKLCLAQFALILRHSGHVRCEELGVLLS